MNAKITEKDIVFTGNIVKRECVFHFFPVGSPIIEIFDIVEAEIPTDYFVGKKDAIDGVLWQATKDKLEQLENGLLVAGIS
ncbi:MAG: hypothetical protein AB7D06_17130 [Pedobacter sp.]